MGLREDLAPERSRAANVAGPEAAPPPEHAPAPGADAAEAGKAAAHSGRRIRSLPARTGVLVACAFTLLAVSLLFSNPPGAAPDEGAHYVRAIGVASGQLVLDKPDTPPPPAPEQLARQMTWMWMQSGMVELPARLSPDPFECWAHPFYLGSCSDQQAPDSPASVRLQTYVGSYPPYPYLLPAALMRPAGTPEAALMLGRAGILLLSVALLVLAVAALDAGDHRFRLVGLLLAVTPMVLYTAASLTSSGVEVAAAICFLACLLRLVRESSGSAGPAPAWVWGAASAAGLVLGIARDLGPAWIGLHLGLVGIFAGAGRVRHVWASAGSRRKIAAALVLAASVAVAVAWRVTAAVPPDLSEFEVPKLTVETVGGLARQVVGVFGPLDALMPDLAYRVWGVLAAGLLVVALVVGTWRQRAALGLAILAAVVVTYALEGAQNIYGFGVQSRHVLPAIVSIPLLAGEAVVSSPRPRWLRARPVLPLLALAVAGVHLTAWHTVGRRFSVGADGPPIFFWEPQWSPPGGWLVWGATSAVACALLVLPFFVNLRKEHRHQPR